jgi:hypothetical protein
MADHQFRNTTVFVRDEAPNIWDPNALVPNIAHPPNGRVVGQAVGGCVAYMNDLLEDIWAAPFGQAFFTAMAAAGKRQVVKYIGAGVPNENSCANPSGACKVRMRASFEDSDWGACRAELTYTLMVARGANIANDMNWLATQILTTPLYRWDTALNVGTSPFNPAGTLPAAPAFATLRSQLVGQLNGFKNGTMQLSPANPLHRELFDLMLLVLRPYLRNGAGGSSMICFNPLKTHTAAGYRPPQAALMHELTHAYYNARGAQMSNEDSTGEATGRYFELAAMGLPPYNLEPYHENHMRAHQGHALRTAY